MIRKQSIRIFTYFTIVSLTAVLCGVLWPSGSRSMASAVAAARAQDPLWKEITPGPLDALTDGKLTNDSLDALRSGQESRLAPERYKAFQLNEAALANILADAPLEFTEAAKDSQKEITLPMPDGAFARFRFVESPIMEPRLAAKFPEFKTYRGRGIDDPTATTRFDRTSDGFHAIVLSSQDESYIAPLSRKDTRTYVSYFTRDAGGTGGMQCMPGLGDRAAARPVRDTLRRSERRSAISTNSVNGTTWRTFRLAVAATGEYTMANGGTVAGAIAAIGTTINQVNAIYLRDLAVSFVLVDNTPIVFTDPGSDGYTSGNVNLLVDENQAKLDDPQFIGESNYDIGHVFDSGTGGKATGLACHDGEKGKGASSFQARYFNFFRMVAHEIGHQFGAEHTFNDPGCSGNLNVDFAYEPGCGVTIMSYGLNISYFHGTSLALMADFLNNCGCGATNNNSNTPPNVNILIPPGTPITFLGHYQIPSQTPFTLTASATDAEDTNLTFSWEDLDQGSPGAPGADRVDNPLFRSFAPTVTTSRTFPQMSTVLGGPPEDETLPTMERSLAFRVTARDNHSPGGGFDQADVVLDVRTYAGPFVVTQPTAGTRVTAGSQLTVAWDVADTDLFPISTSNVRILLSTDNGDSFPHTLRASTPNTGSFTVPMVPPLYTQNARIKVEAINNIFFNVSPVFTITSMPTITATGNLTITRGGPSASAPVATIADAQFGAEPLTLTPVLPFPNGVTLTFNKMGGIIVATGTAQCNATAVTRSITLEVTNPDGLTASTTFNLIVAPDPPPELGNYPNATVIASQTISVTPDRPPSDPNGNLRQVTASIVVPWPPPSGVTLLVDQSSGVVRIITARNARLLTYQIQVVAEGTCGATATKTFFVRVDNSPPQINTNNGNPVRTTQGGVSPAVTVGTVSDQQDAAGALTVSPSYPLPFPSGLTVSVGNSNGTITATATAACAVPPDNYSATVTVRDTSGATASASISIIVDQHLPPTLGTYLDSGVTVGGTFEIVPNVPPSDPNAPNDPNHPVTLTVDPGPLPGGGMVTVLNQTTGRLRATTIANTQLRTYQVIVTATDVCSTTISRSFKLTVRSATCVAEQGAIFVADTGNHRVQRFGGGAWNIIGAGTQGSGLGQFTSPESVVASPDGRKIYIADTGNRRIQWSQDSGGTWAVFASNLVPQGLVLDRDGILYVSDARDNLVMRYAGGIPGTPIVLAGSGSGAGRVSNPNGLAIDCRMNLYIADTGNNRILVIANADSVGFPNLGTVLAGSGAGLNPAQVTAPQGVAVDNSGRLYVADTGNDRVLMIAGAPSPGAATVLCTVGPALGQVRSPEGLTIGAFTAGPLAGMSSIIVSDTRNNRIQARSLPVAAGSWMLLTGQFNLPSKIR